jgi:hypothetical protein
MYGLKISTRAFVLVRIKVRYKSRTSSGVLKLEFSPHHFSLIGKLIVVTCKVAPRNLEYGNLTDYNATLVAAIIMLI